MSGLGGIELLIILVVTVLVFGGPAVVGFWFGYQAGKKAKDDEAGAAEPSAPDGEWDDAEESKTND